MSDAEIEELTFTAQEGRVTHFGELCLRYIPQDRPLRVLDLGCGTGAQIFYLQDRLPQARFVGIDISHESIQAAQSVAERRGGGRARFVADNYLEWTSEPFDVILSDSVLQTIRVADDRLYAKLAGDLVPQGRLLLSLPYDCFYNRALWAFRRVLRPFRGRLFEPIMLGFAKLLHPDWPAELLRERIPYLFMLPVRYDGSAMRRGLTKGQGLSFVEGLQLPQESPAKAKHRLIVYQKSGGAAPDSNPGGRMFMK